MMKQALYILITLFFATACNKSDSFDQDLSHTNLSMVWKEYRVNEKITSSIYPIITDDGVIFSQDFTLGEGESSILKFDKNHGELLWTWSDYFNINRWDNLVHFGKKYIYQNNFLFANGRDIYSINLKSGETNWRNHTNLSGLDDLDGLNNSIFRVGYNEDDSPLVICTNLNQPNWDTIFWSPNLHPELEGILTIIAPYSNNVQNKSYLIMTDLYFNQNTNESINYLTKFDLESDTITNTLLLNDAIGKFDNYPIVESNIMYSRYGNSVVSINLDSMTLNWQTNFPTGSGCSVADAGNYILINVEDRNLYCLNKSDGSIIWKSPSSGTVNNIAVYKDKAYLVGGGDGLLHCYDVNTGEELYTLQSPDYQQNGDAFFMSWLTVDESTGRLYLASYQSAICYQIDD